MKKVTANRLETTKARCFQARGYSHTANYERTNFYTEITAKYKCNKKCI